LEDRLDARAVVDLERGALEAEAAAELAHVRGGRGGLADDREPDALSEEPGAVEPGDPVRGLDLVRVQAVRQSQDGRVGRVEAVRGHSARARRGPAVEGAAGRGSRDGLRARVA